MYLMEKKKIDTLLFIVVNHNVVVWWQKVSFERIRKKCNYNFSLCYVMLDLQDIFQINTWCCSLLQQLRSISLVQQFVHTIKSVIIQLASVYILVFLKWMVTFDRFFPQKISQQINVLRIQRCSYFIL